MNTKATSNKIVQLGFIAAILAVLVVFVVYGNRVIRESEGAGGTGANREASDSVSRCSERVSTLIGSWASSAATQTNTFTACEVIVSKANGCTATFSYQVRGVILTNTLLAVSPPNCGTVGSVGHHTYSISGNTLTIDATVFIRQKSGVGKLEAI